MSAEEAADKTAPADASAGDGGDEEEEWLYGGKQALQWI